MVETILIRTLAEVDGDRQRPARGQRADRGLGWNILLSGWGQLTSPYGTLLPIVPRQERSAAGRGTDTARLAFDASV